MLTILHLKMNEIIPIIYGIKKNPDYVDRYVDTYVHVISREFNRKIYDNIEGSFNQTYLKWIDSQEVVDLLQREELRNTIRDQF